MNGTSDTANPSNSSALRLARWLLAGRNPLARGVDRLESATLVAVVLVGLLLLPVMLVLGSVTYADIIAASQEQTRARHKAVATLTEDGPKQPNATRDVYNSSAVPATWRLPNGATRTGEVRASDGLKAGAKVDIWVNQEGRVVDAPVSSTDAAWVAAVVAVSGWLAAIGLLATAQCGLHHLLNRRRYRDWAQEWECLARDGIGGTDADRR